MLKRCQILLSDWQVDYIKNVAERFDQSFSEVVRVLTCEGLLYIIPLLHPEYKPRIDAKRLKKMTDEAGNSHTSLARQHQLVSELYFEARKAVEYRTNKLKKQKNRYRLGLNPARKSSNKKGHLPCK